MNKQQSFDRMTALISLGGQTKSSDELLAEVLHEAGFDIFQPKLGLASTAELLDELSARNNVGQAASHKNSMANTDELIHKLRKAFVIRIHGLEYRTVDH